MLHQQADFPFIIKEARFSDWPKAKPICIWIGIIWLILGYKLGGNDLFYLTIHFWLANTFSYICNWFGEVGKIIFKPINYGCFNSSTLFFYNCYLLLHASNVTIPSLCLLQFLLLFANFDFGGTLGAAVHDDI